MARMVHFEQESVLHLAPSDEPEADSDVADILHNAGKNWWNALNSGELMNALMSQSMKK